MEESNSINENTETAISEFYSAMEELNTACAEYHTFYVDYTTKNKKNSALLKERMKNAVLSVFDSIENGD